MDGFVKVLERAPIIQKSLDNYGYILLADNMEDAIDAANAIEMCIRDRLQAVGNQVCALERVSFGPLSLDPSLPRGAHRALTEEEISALADAQNQKK